ncbi:MAG: hypothetical protein ACR2GH_05005 [Pseudonocardia sp.]
MNIKLFVGLQFSSRFFSRIAFQSYVDEAVSILNRELLDQGNRAKARVQYKLTDIDSGGRLRDFLSAQIDESDVCVFELSDRNANVLFELGYAYARQKKIVYLVHEDIPLESLPSDLEGTFYRRYGQDNLGIIIADELRTKVLNLISEQISQASFFDLKDALSVNIVCPEIPLKFRIKYAERFAKDYLYKAKFGDSDTLGEIQTHLVRTFPKIRIKEYVSTEIPRDIFSEPLICIGGPGWNSVTRNILDYFSVPIKYGDYSDAVQDFFIRETLRNQEWRTIFSNDKVIRDVGVLGRLPNVQSRTDIYLIHGIQTLGVLGTARSIIEEEHRQANLKILQETLGEDKRYFVALLTSGVIEGNPSPSLLRPQGILVYNPVSGQFQPAM